MIRNINTNGVNNHTMEYHSTQQAKARLLAVMQETTVASSLVVLADMIVKIERHERVERRQVEMDEENRRLWAIVADEYNKLSGYQTYEWIGEADGRARALAALEGHPRRMFMWTRAGRRRRRPRGSRRGDATPIVLRDE